MGISAITCSCDESEPPFVIGDPDSLSGSFWYGILKNRDAFVFYMTNTDRDERLSRIIRFPPPSENSFWETITLERDLYSRRRAIKVAVS